MTNAQTFANEILGTIDAIAGNNDYRTLVEIIKKRDGDSRNAALDEAANEAALYRNTELAKMAILSLKTSSERSGK